MPQQPGHSRFRPEDLATRPVSSFRDLDAMTMYVDYLLMRIGEQREEVERKLVAFEALERDQRARALREAVRKKKAASEQDGRPSLPLPLTWDSGGHKKKRVHIFHQFHRFSRRFS